MKSANTNRVFSRRRSGASGFTLIELMVAITVFLMIGAAAMSLFKQHASLFNDQQYQIGLNVSLRNALAQMENDVVNAGTGWYNAANNVASWPIGVKIVNNTAGGATCHPAGTATYNAACFDTLSLIVPDPTTPPGQVYVAPGTPGCATPATTGTTGTRHRNDADLSDRSVDTGADSDGNDRQQPGDLHSRRHIGHADDDSGAEPSGIGLRGKRPSDVRRDQEPMAPIRRRPTIRSTSRRRPTSIPHWFRRLSRIPFAAAPTGS